MRLAGLFLAPGKHHFFGAILGRKSMNYSLGNTCFLKALSQKMQLPSVFLTPKGFEDCGEHQSRFTLRCFEKPIKCAGLPAATHTKVKFAGPLAGIHFQVNPKAGGGE